MTDYGDRAVRAEGEVAPLVTSAIASRLETLTPEKLATWSPIRYFGYLTNTTGADWYSHYSWGFHPYDRTSPKWYESDYKRGTALVHEADLAVGRALITEGYDVPIFKVENVPEAGIPVLRIPPGEEEVAFAKSLRSDAVEKIRGYYHIAARIVGAIDDGRIITADEIEGRFEAFTQKRNALYEGAKVKERLGRIDGDERVEVWSECTRLHRKAVLFGVLSGLSPAEAHYRICLGTGSIQVGPLLCARESQRPPGSAEWIELALPSFKFDFNRLTYRSDGQEQRSPCRENHLLWLASLSSSAFLDEIKARVGNDVEIFSERKLFGSQHDWQGENFVFVTLKFPASSEDDIVRVLAELACQPSPRVDNSNIFAPRDG